MSHIESLAHNECSIKGSYYHCESGSSKSNTKFESNHLYLRLAFSVDHVTI